MDLKKLIALGLASIFFTTTGCNNTQSVSDTNQDDYSFVENYYKYEIRNKKTIKLYEADNVFLFFNKYTYDVKEYLMDKWGFQVYDLESEELLADSSMFHLVNKEFFYDSYENNIVISLGGNLGDYIEGFTPKDYYTLDEIKDLEVKLKAELVKVNDFILRLKSSN